MAYADDKRIRDLQTDTALPLNWRFPLDYTGLVAAEYRTIQQLVDTVNANLELPNISSGSTNPDNAFGNDGDTYYKFIAGSVFSVWVKISGAWGELFSINLDNNVYFTDSGTTGIAVNLSTGVITITMASFPTIAANGLIRGNFDIRVGSDWVAVDAMPEVTKTAGVITTASFYLNQSFDEIRGRIF